MQGKSGFSLLHAKPGKKRPRTMALMADNEDFPVGIVKPNK